MKKWILKTEITKILNTYSVRKDEFEAKEGLEYYYESRFIKGYLIHISEETKKGGANTDDIKTGRIMVTHTRSNGKITYNDIWERDKEGKLEFVFRNLWNQPFSDAEYIRDIKEDVENMREQYHKLTDDTEYKGLRAAKVRLEMELDEKDNKYRELEEKYQKLINDTNKDLQEEIEKLQQKNQKLINDTKRNARGAGRKPLQKDSKVIEQTRELLEAGNSEQEILEKLGISRATFFRYKKLLKN